MQQSSVAKIEIQFKKAHKREYSDGQILLYQGETASDVFYINSGYVKVYDIASTGEEKLLLLLGPGDTFPLVRLLSGASTMHYFYETVSDVSVSALSREAMIDALNASHEFSLCMLQYYTEKAYELMSRIECIEATSAKHKVAQVLSYLARAHGDLVAKDTYKVRIPTTHQMIANMAGLNRSTASLQMKELSDEKRFKDTDNGGFIIHTDRVQEFLEA